MHGIIQQNIKNIRKRGLVWSFEFDSLGMAQTANTNKNDMKVREMMHDGT